MNNRRLHSPNPGYTLTLLNALLLGGTLAVVVALPEMLSNICPAPTPPEARLYATPPHVTRSI